MNEFTSITTTFTPSGSRSSITTLASILAPVLACLHRLQSLEVLVCQRLPALLLSQLVAHTNIRDVLEVFDLQE